METRERSIGGHSYRVTQFPGRMGLRLQVRLVKLLGPAVGTLAADGNVMDAQIDGGMIGKAVGLLADRLEEDAVEKLVVELLSGTRRDGGELGGAQIDLAFAGHYGELLQVLAFVIEVNYGDFLGALTTGPGAVGQGASVRSPGSSLPS